MTSDDPTRVADTRDWLTKAALDLRAGNHDLEAEPPLLEDALFHAQQAAEKSLKAFLTWHDEPFRRTHDLRLLSQQCVQIDNSLEDQLRSAAWLTQYAWKYRYPGEVEPPSMQDVEEALAISRLIHEVIQSRLPDGT